MTTAAPPAPPAPAAATAGPRALDAHECRELLARVGWGVLATVGDGQPYGVPVSYALGPDCVYLASGPGLKRRHLEADARACLTVCDVEDPDRWRTVVVRGEATRVDGLAARAMAMAAFVSQRAAQGRPGLADARRLAQALLLRLPLDGMTGRARGYGP